MENWSAREFGAARRATLHLAGSLENETLMPNHHHLVLGQADGFYRAYELISAAMRPAFELPPDTPVGAVPQLDASAQQLVSMGEFGFLIPPSVVCLAFAVELILKTILVQDGLLPDPTLPRLPGASRGIHELDKLFDKLPTVHQERIRAAIADDKFEARLAQHAKTFTDWRYQYELGDVYTEDEFLLSVWHAARAIV